MKIGDEDPDDFINFTKRSFLIYRRFFFAKYTHLKEICTSLLSYRAKQEEGFGERENHEDVILSSRKTSRSNRDLMSCELEDIAYFLRSQNDEVAKKRESADSYSAQFMALGAMAHVVRCTSREVVYGH